MTAAEEVTNVPPGADGPDATCALCGLTGSAEEGGVLRSLGAAPVVVTVCADSDGCVTRFAGS